MKILVTGGSGFIGSHLCDRLVEDGHHVVCVDNFSTGAKENVEHLIEKRSFELKELDIKIPFSVEGEIDWICNLASPAHPEFVYQHPIEVLKTNLVGTMNVLELARQKGAGVLQASTSEVYGDPKEHPQKEEYVGHVNQLSTRACYDESKRCAETMCVDYYRTYGIPVRVVRIFNAYGPRMRAQDSRVIPSFVRRALSGEDLIIYGDGTQTRSFQYVDDLVEGFIQMMEIENFVGPVNIGNPKEITIRNLAEQICELTETSSSVVREDPRPADPARRKPDISLAKEKLDWEPSISLKVGLEKTIRYFREVKKLQPK